ncbi:MAG: sensor histidine kinase [Bacillota bacterium]|jgi:signal transduction histidine kinase
MSILAYLASRAAFIIFHLFAGALAIAVIQLDLLQTGGSGLTYGSAAYIVVLHAAMLGIAVVIDYSRQYAFFRRAREIAAAPDPIALVPSLPAPSCAEQRILSRLANAAYTSHTAEALKREEQSQMHVDFTNRWVHAMKTPVSVIDLLVQQSKEVRSADEALPLFDSIQEENERIAHALETMLGMARQERFSLDLLPEQVDLAEVARNVINKHRKEFIRYSIYPSVECHSPTSIIETDEKWITFVVDQLVSNAIKYTRVSRPASAAVAAATATATATLAARADRSRSAGGDRRILILIDQLPAGSHDHTDLAQPALTLTVRDHGIGIPIHDLPRVFDPFFTGENGRLAPESTGMGLFLARKICASLGHTITAQSQPGQGAAMTITFSTTAITHGVDAATLQ